MRRRRDGDDAAQAISAISSRRRGPSPLSMQNVGTRVDTVQGAHMSAVALKGNVARTTEKSVWLKDRVTLSVEAQLLLMEQRRSNPIDWEAMEYTNRIPKLEIKSNIFVEILPYGAYRLKFTG